MTSAFPHAWTWFRVGLHVLAAVLMAVVAGNLLAEPSAHRTQALVAAAVCTLLYLLGTGRWVRGSRPRVWVWLLVLVASWLAVLWWVPDALFLAFPLYFLVAHVLPLRWAVPGVAAVAVLGVTGFAAHRGFSVAVAIGPILGAVVALGTVVGLRTVDRESSRRGVLVERERLAREVHDTVAQGLASINLLLSAASARLASAAASDADVAAALGLVDQARDTAVTNLTEARLFVQALAPSELSVTPLVDLLQRTVREFPPATFVSLGAPLDLPQDTQVALVRVTREALNNSTRHAHAERIGVTLTWLEDEVSLDVVDDGRGFDQSRRAGGFGLRSIRSRVEELGGRVAVESTVGQGTAIAVSLPVPRQQPGAV